MNTSSLKRNLAHVGTNIHYAGASLGSSMKLKFSGGDFDADNDLLHNFRHDVKQIIRAVKFVEKQTERTAASYWPQLFKATARSARNLLALVGEESLAFKDIDRFYDQFDELQMTSEAVVVHPKERQHLVASIHYELVNYLATIDGLQTRVVQLAEAHAAQVKVRTLALVSHMKHILKALKARDKHQARMAKVAWKAERLAKKTAPLSTSEQNDLDSYQLQLGEASDQFASVNTKLKTIAPETLSLVEEFVDELVKWDMCHHRHILDEISSTLRYFAVFHGYVNSKRANSEEEQELIISYDHIIDQWETSCTPARLLIESFVQTIYSKNPELLDEQVDDQDKSLKLSKAWTLVALKVTEKLHVVKAKDKQNGIFTLDSIADPLRSYAKFEDLSLNVSETYHPRKVLEYDQVYPDIPSKPTPPPLPPRDEFHRIHPVYSPTITSTPSNVHINMSTDSLDSIHSDTELSLNTAGSDSDSDADSELSSILLTGNHGVDSAEKQLIRIYNSSKNDITEAPIDTSNWINLDRYKEGTDLFDDRNTASYQLHGLNKFFQKILKNAEKNPEKKILVAKKDFEGIQPGDLSFAEGDEVEVLFDLQSVAHSYNEKGQNWLVAAAGTEPTRRIGFAPNTYF